MRILHATSIALVFSLINPLLSDARTAQPATPPGQVLVVAANLQEAFDDVDVADDSDMRQFVKRLIEQVPHVPDVLLVNEVRRESAETVAGLLSEATGQRFAMAVDPGERPHRENDQVRETSIILNTATMQALDEGGFVQSHFPPEARGPHQKFRVRHKDHAYLLAQEMQSGIRVALLSVHLAHAYDVQNKWVAELAKTLERKYPQADMRIIGGDFNMSRVEGLGNWKKETLDGPPKQFWKILTEQHGYNDAILSAAPDEIPRAQELNVARIDYIFVQGDVVKAASDLSYRSQERPDDRDFYSDHRFFWAIAAVNGAKPQAAQAHAQQASQKLNVLLITSDDLGGNALGTYGNRTVKTPNIDRLASRGVRFDRAYCQLPLCGPSRASFMTGMRPNSIGVLNNGRRVREKHPDVITLPQVFMNDGYFSARTGKIYHQGIPGGVGGDGLDDPQSWHHTHNPPGAEFSTPGEEFDPTPKNGQGFRRVIGEGEGVEQADYQAADEAIRLLREHRDKPFFLAVGFIRPHVPVIAPKKYFDLYDLKELKLPHVPEDDRGDIPRQAYHRQELNFGMDEQQCLESLRAYYASTSFMDAQVGRVLDELDALGLTEKTIIVFLSDHGYMLGEHHTWQKMMLFEPVSKSPLIMAGPGITRGAAANGIVEFIDIYPTVVELAGYESPEQVDGKSVLALLKDPSKPGKEAAYTQLRARGREGRTIRTDRWRYIEWNGGEATELYDHHEDPDEFTNLAKNADHAATIRELRRQLHQVLPPPSDTDAQE